MIRFREASLLPCKFIPGVYMKYKYDYIQNVGKPKRHLFTHCVHV